MPPRHLDQFIHDLRVCLYAGYALQALQCTVGAFNTGVGMMMILNHYPLLGGILIITAFFMGVEFCNVAAERVLIRQQISAMCDMRKRAMER